MLTAFINRTWGLAFVLGFRGEFRYLVFGTSHLL